MKSKWVACIAVGICLTLHSSVSANAVSFDYDWSDPKQPNEGCAHIALANILDYWDETWPDLVPAAQEPSLVDNEADALSTALQDNKYLGPSPKTGNWELSDGLKQWFKDRGVGLSTKQSGMYAGEIPSWNLFASEIDKGEKVLLLFDWSGDNHWVAAFGKSTAPNQFVVHDPNSPGKNEQEYAYTTDAQGYMHVQYKLNDVVHDSKITQIISVTAIPEPLTLCMVPLAALAALVKLRRRFAP